MADSRAEEVGTTLAALRIVSYSDAQQQIVKKLTQLWDSNSLHTVDEKHDACIIQ